MKTQQKILPFDGTRETARQERLDRIYREIPQVKPASRLFDDQAFAEATEIARRTCHQPANATRKVQDSKNRKPLTPGTATT